MFNQTRILIISDIETFIITMMPQVLDKAVEYHVNNNEIDYFFDWAINQILVEFYGMKVIHHYRHDIYLIIYKDLVHNLLTSFKRCVNIYDLEMLKGCYVKTLVNGRDLFITRRNAYNTF